MPEHSIALALAERFISLRSEIDTVTKQLEHHRTMVDLCPLPCFMADTKGNCVYINRIFGVLLGARIEDMQGDLWHHYIVPSDLDSVIATWTAFINSPIRNFESEIRYLHHDGHAVTMLIKAAQAKDLSIVGYGIPLRFETIVAWARGIDLARLHDLASPGHDPQRGC